MAAAAIHSSPLDDLFREICRSAQKLAAGQGTRNFSSEIFNLNQQIGRYVKQVDRSNPRSHFFAVELNLLGHYLRRQSKQQIPHLAQKVLFAVGCLFHAQRSSIQRPNAIKHPDEPSTEFAELLKEGNLAALHDFTKQKAAQIGKSQVPKLCDLAVKNWDVKLLNRILLDCTPRLKQVKGFIESALQRNDFGYLSYPIMFYYFHRLSEELRERVLIYHFQATVNEILAGDLGEGSLELLLDLHLMQTLTKEVREKILLWADNNDDKRVFSFFIAHDLVSSETLNAIVSASFDSNTFDEIAEAVYPDKFSLLDDGNKERVQAWYIAMENESQPGSAPEPT